MTRFFRFSMVKHRYNSLNSLSTNLVAIQKFLFALKYHSVLYLQRCCSRFILNMAVNNNSYEITCSRKNLLFIAFFLKNHTLNQSNFSIDYTVIDNPGKRFRFECVVLLLSSVFGTRIKVRFFTDEKTPLMTLSCFFKIAFWLEREVWDMFGVIFQNHGDLRRLLTDYGFWGHALRKDFPLTGYSEIFFDDFVHSIRKKSVSLAQEYRYYEFQNSWL